MASPGRDTEKASESGRGPGIEKVSNGRWQDAGARRAALGLLTKDRGKRRKAAGAAAGAAGDSIQCPLVRERGAPCGDLSGQQ